MNRIIVSALYLRWTGASLRVSPLDEFVTSPSIVGYLLTDIVGILTGPTGMRALSKAVSKVVGFILKQLQSHARRRIDNLDAPNRLDGEVVEGEPIVESCQVS